MVQNTVKIDKNGWKCFLYNTTGVPKNYLILINTLANYFIKLFLNDVLFIMKLLWTNCEIIIPDFSYNKSNIN